MGDWYCSYCRHGPMSTITDAHCTSCHRQRAATHARKICSQHITTIMYENWIYLDHLGIESEDMELGVEV